MFAFKNAGNWPSHFQQNGVRHGARPHPPDGQGVRVVAASYSLRQAASPEEAYQGATTVTKFKRFFDNSQSFGSWLFPIDLSGKLEMLLGNTRLFTNTSTFQTKGMPSTGTYLQ